jgi:pimeloyl-ACP methyl ester carboxylesterase
MKSKRKSLRKYGNPPYKVAVIHGGPGAPGSMAPVAKALSSDRGVLEPLQTASSIDGQLRELYTSLEQNAELPVTLIGWSWGAWLSFLFAAEHPGFVSQLILIGSGPFEQKYAPQVLQTRFNRLTDKQKDEYHELCLFLDNPAIEDKSSFFKRMGKLFDKVDAYVPSDLDNEIMEVQYEIFRSVWNEAFELRKSGRLLKRARSVRCPVTAIHGDYDPHPYEGVKRPLSRILKNFRFILLKNCGHKPWIEQEAKDRFFDCLKNELA